MRLRTPRSPALRLKGILSSVAFRSIGRASSPGSRKSPDADIRVVEPSGGSPCLGSALWTPDAVGNLYVFKGSSVPALLEVYTSPSCDDYIRVQRWLGLWFSTSEGADTITPPMVPVVFPVCDDSDNADNAGDPLARDNYLKRRNLYRRQWMLEASQSLAAGVPGPTFGAPGSSCLVMNGEYITLCELEKLDITPFPKSSSKGVLKVLLADESTVLCTYQPMQSIKSMIGNLVANVAVVACGARCTCRGHQAYRMDTHHSVVLSTHQMPLVRQDCDSYHVAGLDLARHAMAPSGMQSLGLVVWITHGFIDSTPMAVGYCGLSIPKE